RRWLPYASAHARAHLGVLLACFALTLTWGAVLDPVQTVAGLHGALTQGPLAARLPAAPFVAVLGVAATLASLVWGMREKPVLLAGSVGALPGGGGRGRGGRAGTPAAAALAARGGGGGGGGGGGRAMWIVVPMPDLDSLAHTRPIPEWTEIHRGRWTHAGRAVAALEGDTGLELAPLLTRDSTTWFGPGFREFAVAAPDTWPGVRGAGLPLSGGWRRYAM